MEDFADINAILGATLPRNEISPVEKLLNEFEAHEAKEDRALEFYKNALARLPNPATRFIMQLILSDEEKHRAIIHAMAATLKSSLTWTNTAGTLEAIGGVAGFNGELREVTDKLIDLERSGIREYKTLAAECSGYYHGTFKVLLDGMIRDSEKHLELLQFLKETLTDI
jgi:rubrerythrin